MNQCKKNSVRTLCWDIFLYHKYRLYQFTNNGDNRSCVKFKYGKVLFLYNVFVWNTTHSWLINYLLTVIWITFLLFSLHDYILLLFQYIDSSDEALHLSFSSILIYNNTRGATVPGCAPVLSFCCKGLY